MPSSRTVTELEVRDPVSGATEIAQPILAAPVERKAGFENGYFVETARFDPSDSKTHFGYTLDLATNAPGAREVVGKPVPSGDTHLVRRYS